MNRILNYLTKSKNIYPVLLILIVMLSLIIYVYPILKPVPVGTDSVVYINGANWLVDNQQLPESYQETYNGIYAYTARFTDINISIFKLFSGLDIAYPIFSIYQMFLIFLLVISSYLVGSIFSKRMSILFPLLLIGSHSIIRLFMGSTISNILAFVYINFIFYLMYQFIKSGRYKFVVLIFILLVGIFLTHNYLTGPIFIVTFFIYLVFLLKFDKNLNSSISILFNKINKKFIFGLLISSFLGIFYYLFTYSSIFQEAKKSFWQTRQSGRFMGDIYFSQYGAYLGEFLFILGIIGLIYYLFNFKKNILSFKILPVIWFIIVLFLLQTYKIGITFYFERLVFLLGIFIAFFAAYFIDYYLKKLNNKLIISLSFSVIIVLIIISGTNRVVSLYDSSNKVTESSIEALTILKNNSDRDDVIFSNFNTVSGTSHDIIISDRKINRFYASEKKCAKNLLCYYFNNPNNKDSLDYFIDNNVNFFIIIRPGYDSNADTDELIKKFNLSDNFSTLYYDKGSYLFEII